MYSLLVYRNVPGNGISLRDYYSKENNMLSIWDCQDFNAQQLKNFIIINIIYIHLDNTAISCFTPSTSPLTDQRLSRCN